MVVWSQYKGGHCSMDDSVEEWAFSRGGQRMGVGSEGLVRESSLESIDEHSQLAAVTARW